ncbi:MAG: sigma-70 family RNA polymerase sigma factor [Chloroflexi bacterium]|nr:sigma-70 family RNA polymerase sigma factor [Chloroflexota bacterium]
MNIGDLELIRRSKEGDLDAFNEIVARYQRQVFNTAARVLGGTSHADDATQETFISAYRAIGSFRGVNLAPWLLRIAKNQCYDMIRSMRRRPADSLEENLANPSFVRAQSGGSAEDETLRSELGAEIQRAILSLPVDQRLVVTLIDVQGFSYEEAAEAAEVSIGTVKSRLSRGRARVRDHLRGLGELLPPEFRQTI